MGQWLSSIGTLSFLGGTKLVIVHNLHEAFEKIRSLSDGLIAKKLGQSHLL